jgi:WD40 repeat protein
MKATSTILLALLCGGIPLSAGSLKQLWEIQLNKTIRESQSVGVPASHFVSAVSFSPSGDQIAIIADLHQEQNRVRSHLLIFGIESPRSAAQQIDFESVVEIRDLRWLNSDAVVANQNVISLKTQRSTKCAWPDFMQPIGQELLVARIGRNLEPSAPQSQIGFAGLDCQIIDSWTIPELWSLRDTTPERGLAIVSRAPNSYSSPDDIVVVDMFNKTIRQRWTSKTLAHASEVKFAESGRSVCFAGTSRPSCWDVDSGAKIAEFPRENGDAPLKTSAASSLAVITIPRYRPYLLIDGGSTDQRNRTIWDFRSSQEIASWRGEMQHYELKLGELKPQLHESPSAFAISPNGLFLSDGANGRLRLYRILR